MSVGLEVSWCILLQSIGLEDADQAPVFCFAERAALANFHLVAQFGHILFVMDVSMGVAFEDFPILGVARLVLEGHLDGFVS